MYPAVAGAGCVADEDMDSAKHTAGEAVFGGTLACESELGTGVPQRPQPTSSKPSGLVGSLSETKGKRGNDGGHD
jgi:hypothetical protein